MAEQQEQDKPQEKHPGIRDDRYSKWEEYVKDAIENEPGEKRDYALSVVKQVSTLIRALAANMDPGQTIKLIEPETSFVKMPMIISSVISFSVRGEEFRLWWNSWHDRVHPLDVPAVAVDQMNAEQKTAWDTRWAREGVEQPAVFNPFTVNIKGKTFQMAGSFDPTEPLTKSPKYLENVNALVQKLRTGEPVA